MGRSTLECPDCGTENDLDAIVCMNCRYKFVDLVLENEELFFIHEKGNQPIRKEIVVRNEGGSEIVLEAKTNLSSNQLPIEPYKMELGPGRSGKFMVTLIAVSMKPSLHSLGELTVSIPNRPDFVKNIPVFYGLPPEPEIQIDKSDLKKIYRGNIKNISLGIRNKNAGTITLDGYFGKYAGKSDQVVAQMDDAIGESVFKFKEPIIIKNKNIGVIIPLDFSKAKSATIDTQITLMFAGDVGNKPLDISVNIMEPPSLMGNIEWNTINEIPSRDDFEDPEYQKSQNSLRIDKDIQKNINLNLGSVPENVTSKINISLQNPSAKGYKATIVLEDIPKGMAVGIGSSASHEMEMAMDSGYVFESSIHVTANEKGNQSFHIRISYDDTGYGLPELDFLVSLSVVELKKSVRVYGIDFGTTNSCISYYGDREAVTVSMEEISNEQLGGQKEFLYSFCCFPDQYNPEESYVGRSAEDAYARRTDSIGIKSIKTKLGTEWKALVGGNPLFAKDIAGIIIKELISRSINDLCVLPSQAIITVPANSSLKKIKETMEAYSKAGINIMDENVIYEPEAATYHYLLETQGGKEILSQLSENDPFRILTFDFGGGTLDISIVQIQKIKKDEKIKMEIRVLKSTAKNIGGDNIDWNLRRDAIQKSALPANERDQYWKPISALDNRSELNQTEFRDLMLLRLNLIRYCERTKIRYSNTKNVKNEIFDITPKNSNSGIPINILRSDLDEVCKQLMPEIRAFVDQVIQSTKLDGNNLNRDDIDKVLMVGGSSSIPMVQQEIGKMFGNSNVEFLGKQAKMSVSRGAALYANEIQNPRSIYAFSKVEPKVDIRIGYQTNTQYGQMFMEIFKQGTLINTQSQKTEMAMPPSGVYKLTVATNKGNNDEWSRKNPDITQIAEPFFRSNPDDTIEEWFELNQVGNLVWYIKHDGNITQTEIPISERAESGDDDPGF